MTNHRFIAAAFFFFAFATLCSCAKPPIPLDEKSVGDLMMRLNEASAKMDFAGVAKCYSDKATIEIDRGRNKKTLTIDEYIKESTKNAGTVKEYQYQPEDLKIAVGNESAMVTQTVLETVGAAMMPVRSRTEAEYTVRIERGEPRIVGVTARVIVAGGRSDPLPDLPTETAEP